MIWAAAALTLACLGAQAQDNEAAWRATLEQIRPSVVSLRVNKTRPFDTESNTLLDGTGFVVDAGRGIILTNRHIVSTGPVKGEALFANQEEIELERLYADPVHDFGFFRYDPDGLRHIRPEGLKLAPEGAQLGREIRVVGNDAGERFSILAGTIARLDRTAPNYGFGRYNDFNTFYIQAASGTSGGSSGSPVIDIEGRAVALNAGGQVRAQSSYFLPLERVRRALALIQEGRPVPRGGLLTTFEQLPYDELRRLGLGEENEADARAAFPQSAGLLVVRSTLKGSAASSALTPGDILLRIGEEEFPDFLRLEALLDQSVGQTVTVLIERGGSILEAVIEVSDPARRNAKRIHHFRRDLSAPHLLSAGAPLQCAAEHHLRGAARIFSGTGPRSRTDQSCAKSTDSRWPRWMMLNRPCPRWAMRMWRSCATARREIPAPISCEAPAPAVTGSPPSAAGRAKPARIGPAGRCNPQPPASAPEPRMTQPRRFEDSRLRRIASSLVHVRFDMPYVVSAVNGQHYYGAGLIVDTERGWVVVDRNTVPETIGDAVLTFNGTLEVTAEVAAIHPVHNLAVLQYDPALLGDTPLEEAAFAPRPPRTGEDIYLAGFRPDLEPVIRSYEAGGMKPINLAPSNFGAFREANLEILEVENADTQISGVLLDSRARVVAMWSSFASGTRNRPNEVVAGLPIEHVEVMLDHLRREAPWRSLEVEWQRAPLSVALRRGLPDTWRLEVEQHDNERRQLLVASRTVAGAPASDEVQPGDLLLTVNGSLATRPRDVERAVAGLPRAELLVWRNGEELALSVDTVELGWEGLQEVLFWGGAVIQDPQRGMAAQMAIRPQGVTIQHYTFGSPAPPLSPADPLFAGHDD